MTDALHEQLQVALRKGYVAAFRLLGNADESREACQEAAAKALAAKHSYDVTKPFYPWFYRILKNHCLDRLRARKRNQREERDVELVEQRQSAESMLVENERSTMVLGAIQELSDEHREVIELRHFQDLSYEEMALILEVPTGTVMSRLYRARKALRLVLMNDSSVGVALSGQEGKR
jgi:RNA polymerase sigma-70 factor (ECF subfamily)